jgi:hypothetical protein
MHRKLHYKLVSLKIKKKSLKQLLIKYLTILFF